MKCTGALSASHLGTSVANVLPDMMECAAHADFCAAALMCWMFCLREIFYMPQKLAKHADRARLSGAMLHAQGEICDIEGRCIDAAEDEMFKLTTKEGRLTMEREKVTTDTSDFDAGLIFEQDPVQILDAILPLYLNSTLLRSLQVPIHSHPNSCVYCQIRPNGSRLYDQAKAVACLEPRTLRRRLCECPCLCETWGSPCQEKGLPVFWVTCALC